MKKNHTSMRTRIIILMGALLLLGFIPIIAQVFKVTVVDHDWLQAQAIEQQTRDTIVNPPRGTIYDRNLKPLAESATVETVFLSPMTMNSDQKQLVAQKLSELLDVDYEKTYAQTQKRNQYELVKRKLEKEDADKVRNFINEYQVKGVHLVEDTKRYYPYGNFAAHVLGFTGNDNQGLDGIESLYDKTLTGTRGRIVTAKDAAGNALPFQYENYVDAQSGTSIVLTIDEVIQHIAEKYLEEAVIESQTQEKGIIIILDVETAEVLALAIKPDFDPNSPFDLDEITLETIAELPQEEQGAARNTALQAIWRNKAVVDTYYPGSVFKIVTAAMGLEENVVTPSSEFHCGGYITIGKWRINCQLRRGHGHETFVQGVLNSCNPVFMTVGARLGSENFYKYFEAFGLLEKTGVDLPGEAVGIFHQKSNFNEVELATASFGQNFSVTPMQMITSIAAVANGGKLMTPHVVKQYLDGEGNVMEDVEPAEKRQVISEETSKTLSDILERVVTEGTGGNAYAVGYRVAGKTGTSEKIDKQNKTGLTGLRIASFGAYAPADNPKIAVLVILDEPGGNQKYGGQIAAPVVSKVVKETLEYLNVEPQYTQEELDKLDITVPNVIDSFSTLGDAQNYLRNSGINYRVIGTGETVTNQMPKPNTKMPSGGTIILYTNENPELREVVVPSVKGTTPSRANSILTNRGLNMSTSGSKSSSGVYAARQYPEAGTTVTMGSTITVEFRDPNSTLE